MGTARDLFRRVGWAVHGKPDAYETLCRAAELWRAEGQPFSTGMAMLRAVDAAWGRPEIMLDAHHAALRDFERVVVEQPPDTPAALAALFKLLRTPLEDRRAMTFISNAADAFRGFKSDPDTELTRDRLGIALNALAKIPVIGPDVADAARPEIGKSVRLTLEGLVRTWAHRSLGSIGDEAVLRRVLLRLLQGTLPRYAQIRHGPIEYGKDIAALADDGGVSVLCLYQVKCGEMNTPKWRGARAELEEMFLVPMSEFQLPVSPQRIEGYLVTNGHANTHVEPVMEGWFEEQRRDHGRDITFMHLDKLVDWIFKVRLVNELRAALDEESIKVS